MIARRMRSERQVLTIRAGEPGGDLLQIALTNVGKLARDAVLPIAGGEEAVLLDQLDA